MKQTLKDMPAPARSAASTAMRSLDHFVLYADDLEVAANLYRKLGFRVLPPMEHAEIGTSNVIVQFQDTYLEIIGDFDHCRVPELQTHMGPWLALGKVYWMTSLTSAGLEADRAVIEAQGLSVEPIRSARRRLRLPRGGWTETDSRSMYVWNEANLLTSLFVSDHRRREAIWTPGYQCHPNGATRVLGMTYLASDPTADISYFAKMFGGPPAETSSDRVAFRTPRGETFEILSEAACREAFPEAGVLQPGVAGRGAAMTVAVESIERCGWALRDGGIASRAVDETSLVVGSDQASGLALRFTEEAST